MAVDAPVILSALFFTIIAIIIASVFLAKKSAPKNGKQKREKEARPEHTAEVSEPRVKPTIAEKRQEEPVLAPPVVEDIGVADEPPVLEAEIASVHHAQVQVNAKRPRI
ncbi:hypothetical protein AOLI_G00173670 [Acnodon oligacanthus]